MDMSENDIERVVEEIIGEVERSTMLGAGWYCLSPIAQAKFKDRVADVLRDA